MVENEDEGQGNSRELKEIQGNDEDNPGNPGSSATGATGGFDDRKDIPDIVKTLAKHPETRRELITWVKKEFGFNIESWLEEYFDELPDKKYKIEDLAMPLREIAENVIGMTDDGYSPSQIASDLGIYRTQVSRILKEREKWEKDIAGAARKQIVQNKKLPWYLRLAARLRG